MPDEYGFPTRRESVAALEQWLMPTQQRRDSDLNARTVAAALRSEAAKLSSLLLVAGWKQSEVVPEVVYNLRRLADSFDPPARPHYAPGC